MSKMLMPELKKSRSLPFLFVGSGISRRYLQTPSWKELLEHFAHLARPDFDYPFESYQEELRGNDSEQTPLEIYPKLASMIEIDFNKLWHKNIIWAESRKQFSDLVKKGVSPFKIEVAHFFEKFTFDKALEDSTLKNELKLLLQISNQSIAGVITTNYDTFLEDFFKDFIPYIGQEELLFSDLKNIGEIYKIHGCSNKPESLIITESDYKKFIEQNPYLAAKLITIFIEHPIIFLGYSLSDQNILNLLNSLTRYFSPTHLSIFEKKLFFIQYDTSEAVPVRQVHTIKLQNSFSLTISSISTNNFITIFDEISQIKAQYPVSTLRQLKNYVYDLLLDRNTTKKKLFVHDYKTIDFDDDDLEIVAGVGVLDEIGYKIFTPALIYADVVLGNQLHIGNKQATPEKLALETIPYLLPRHGHSIPYYKYIENMDYNTLPAIYHETNAKLIKKSIDDFLSSTRKKQRNILTHKNIDEIQNDSYLSFQGKLERIICLSESQLPLDELENFLKNLFQPDPSILEATNTKYKQAEKTTIRILVRIYDWRKFAKKIRRR